MSHQAWDREAEEFDDEPVHGLQAPTVRAAWRDLILGVLPAAPARVADLRHLPEPVHWGKEIHDERYLLVSRN